ncbi:MAG: response regulator [Deltaproteobacteria bacterium]|nr:response regulator [Deltaproteobacteria bacterium]MBT7714465.1 response regulator [Deltaproteobacteria bacterium]
MNNKLVNILLVEDDDAHAELIGRSFEEHSDRYQVRYANSLQSAYDFLNTSIPDIVVADMLLPDGKGIQLLTRNEQKPTFPMIVMTSYGDEKMAVQAIKQGALDYIVKSESIFKDMPRVVERILREWGHIVKRNEAEKALRERERQLRRMIEKSPFPMVITDDNQDIEFFNDKFTELFGYTLKDVSTADKWWKTCYPDEEYREQVQKSWMEAIEKAQATNSDIEMQEWEWTIKDKSKKLCEFYMVPLSGSSLIVMNDITEKRRVDDQIKSSLKEKEILLQEIHHRVKNNMQVITSLLKLQSNNIQDEQIKDVLKDSQSRVHAMSAVHETLHGSQNLSEIDLKSYLSKITNSIFQTYATDHRKVKLNNNVEYSPISINQAYPLGLITNELITNSLKYAFPDNLNGEITVSVKKLDKELELTVMDNGIGMPVGLDWKNSSTLGLKLVRTLVENQLEGAIDMESNNGTKFIIKFNIVT